MTYNKLGFAFTGLKTLSFAPIDSAYKKTGAINFMTGLSFGLDVDDHTVTCTLEIAFEKKEQQPFLVLKTQGQFEIDKNDFKDKISQKDGTFLVTKDLATHLAVLTIGSARGILHAKTEGTVYNQYLLPTIDVKEMIEEDVVFGN